MKIEILRSIHVFYFTVLGQSADGEALKFTSGSAHMSV